MLGIRLRSGGGYNMDNKYSALLRTQCDLTDLYRNQLHVVNYELKKARNTIHNLRALLVSFTSDFQIKSPEFQPFLDFINQNCEDDKRLADLEDSFKSSITRVYTECICSSSLSQLPSDLILVIIEFLGVKELTVFSYTCKEIYSMCQSSKIWRKLARSRWNLAIEDKSQVLKKYSQEMLWFHTRPTVSTLIGHHGSVTCLSLSKESSYLISGSDDCSLYLWELGKQNKHDTELVKQHHIQTKSITKKVCFYGHGGPVWSCCEGPFNTLISGSHDKTLKIWNLQTGQCQSTMRGHNAWVSSLDCTNEVIVSSAWDETIKIWSQETKTLIDTLNLQNDTVYCLKLRNNETVLGLKSKNIQIWDLNRNLMTMNCTGHFKAVNAVKIEGNLVVSASADSLVKVWDIRNGECVGNLPGHSANVMCIDFDIQSQRIVSGGYDKTIRVWDMRNWISPRNVLRGHSQPVFSLKFDDKKLISGSMDQSIKVWNFQCFY